MVMNMTWDPVPPPENPKWFVDPYWDWTVATKFLYYGSAKKLPMLVEFDFSRAQEIDEFLAQNEGSDDEFVRHLRARRAGHGDTRNLKFLSVLVPKDDLSGKRSPNQIPFVRRYQLCRSVKLSEAALPAVRSRRRAASSAGSTSTPPLIVVSGVIDDGIAFAHERFRGRDGKTRVEWFWDQSEPATNVASPSPWDYGRELTKQDIDNLLTACTHGNLADEEELYRQAGFADQALSGHKPLAWRAAHGTVVADIACGADPSDGRPANPIVAVQLPIATTADTSGGTLAKQAFDAIHYILLRAEKIAQANGLASVPVVINLSYGLFAGPHDGTSMLETAINEFIRSRVPSSGGNSELCVVIPAGNSYLSRCHANFCLKSAEERELTWRVLPDDRTESFLEIWLPKQDEGGSPPVVEVTVTTPTGATVVLDPQAAGSQWVAGNGSPVCSVMRYTEAQTLNRPLISISLAPTASPDGGIWLAPSGAWRIKLKNCGSSELREINAWIQRDDAPYGYPQRGRQSYFDDPKYCRFDDAGREIEDDNVPPNQSSVRRNGSINAIATGQGPIVVGGFRRSDRRYAKYSAAGPVVHPPGRGAPSDDGPDAMAASEDSVACHGVLGSGARSGSTVAMNGTSVAAPRVARALVDYMIANPGNLPNRQTVFDWACQAEGNPPQCAADVRRGGGRLKLSEIAPTSPIRRVDEP